MNIVILHGWGQDARVFQQLQKQLESLPNVQKVVSLDLPGFGTRKLINNDWDIPNYAQWVDEQIKKLNKKHIVLLGHSFGGRIAAFLASQKPDYLSALVLSGAPVLYRPSNMLKVRNNVFKILKKILPSPVKSSTFSSELKEAEAVGLGNVFRKVVLFDQTKNLPNISVPTLLIWGELDSAAPLSIAKEAQTLIPDSKLFIIKKAQHNSFHSHPYIFFGYVKEFLKNL